MNKVLITLLIGIAYFMVMLMTPYMINYEDNNPVWKRVVINIVHYGWGLFFGWIVFSA